MTENTARRRVPLSVLDLAIVPEGSTGQDAVRQAVALASDLDRLGYHRVWYAEHHLSPGVASASPAVLAAAVAARTERIRVGSGAVLLSTTSPLVAAEQFGTIAALHPGRVDLGLGRAFTPPTTDGTSPAATAAERTARPVAGARVVDGLYVPGSPPVDLGDPALRARFLAQKRVVGASRAPQSFEDELRLVLDLRAGTYRDENGTAYASPPVEGADLDLWVLASSPGESARVAGALGLPLAANYHVSPSTTLETVAAYREAFRPGVLDEPYVVVSADVLVADTTARARAVATPFADWVLSIRRGADGAIAFPRPGGSTAWEDRTAIERALVADRVDTRIVGDPQTVVSRLETLQRVTGADELLVTTATHDPADARRSFALLAEHWAADTSSTGPRRGPAATTVAALRAAADAGAEVADGALLVDVRSIAGRSAAGSIPGAVVVDRSDLDAVFGTSAAPAVSFDTPVVVVCGSENGSRPVAEALVERGYTRVSHVAGGFAAWRDAGMPAEPADREAAATSS